MRAFLAMVKANLKMVVRNRQALFWNLAFPGLFIVIFGAVFGRDTGVDFTVGVAGAPSALRDSALAAMEQSDAFTVRIGDEAEEMKKLRDGDRDVVLVFGWAPDGGGQPAVQISYDETAGPSAHVAVSAVRQVLFTAAQGENPVPITEQPVTGEEISFIDFFVPGILGMALMNSGVIGLSTAFVTYRERGILRRIKVTPFPLSSFILARIASQLVVAYAQAIILIGMARLLFGLHLRGNILVIAVTILLGALAFLAIGFAISGFARNAETAASYANLITFPMLFLSGVFFDLDNVPAWIQPITRVLPLRYLVDALREPMTRSRGLADTWPDLLVLAGTFLVGMVVAVRFFRWEARGT
ncbi:MAG: type transport system permease protein [Thermomicrobiales bacterium]|nr:type transport system permease protein [Thermomicrobiales bacterium]